jgi:threonine/homoserine/homoserine lactone efflux protein
MARPPGQRTDLQALAHDQPPAGMRRVFMGGFWTNLLNPKVAIFFLAFVPQFIAPDAAHKTLAFLALGLLFNVNSLPVNAGWAWTAAWVARHDGAQRRMHWLDKVAGAMFILFGLKLALSDAPGR